MNAPVQEDHAVRQSPRLAIKTPAYRRGKILRATEIEGSSEVALERDPWSAHALASIITRDLEPYLLAIKNGIHFAGEAAGWEIKNFHKRENSIPRGRYAPGFILDLPVNEFQVEGLQIRERTCLTVCRGKMSSKVWSRFLLTGAEREVFSSETANLFYEISDHLVSEVICQVEEVYLDHFNEQIAQEKGKLVRFDEVGNLRFFGFDIGQSTAEGDLVADQDIKSEFARITAKCDSSPSIYSNLSFDGNTIRREPIGEGRFADYIVSYHENAADFFVMSQPLHELAAEKAIEKGYVTPSGALTAMAELATRVGSKF
ncbi:MAG: hypothetical protein AAGI28_10655 [Pseudomonadota bacterium]